MEGFWGAVRGPCHTGRDPTGPSAPQLPPTFYFGVVGGGIKGVLGGGGGYGGDGPPPLSPFPPRGTRGAPWSAGGSWGASSRGAPPSAATPGAPGSTSTSAATSRGSAASYSKIRNHQPPPPKKKKSPPRAPRPLIKSFLAKQSRRWARLVVFGGAQGGWGWFGGWMWLWFFLGGGQVWKSREGQS